MSHNGGQDLLRVLGEAIRAGDLLGTGPGGGLNASTTAQRGQSQDGSCQGHRRQPYGGIGHGAGGVEVEIEVRGNHVLVLPRIALEVATASRHPGHHPRRGRHRGGPVDIGKVLPGLPGLQVPHEGVVSAGPAHGRQTHEIGSGGLLIVAGGDLQCGHVDTQAAGHGGKIRGLNVLRPAPGALKRSTIIIVLRILRCARGQRVGRVGAEHQRILRGMDHRLQKIGVADHGDRQLSRPGDASAIAPRSSSPGHPQAL